ncbi:MAG: bifunctional hydroxymethylpyrimidine kinase/phosphomethylpyrimidine kinase [Acidimicrobiales bacterium]
MTPKVGLTIAGSDSSGGAGIQADLETFAAHGVYGTSAITAITAQNTVGVLRTVAVDPDMVAAQVNAVLDDIPPQATKTGMLANPRVVEAVAGIAAKGMLPNLVVDPVLVSTSGHALMTDGGVQAYRDLLLPLAVLVTPNVFEAALLASVPPEELATLDAAIEVAQGLRALGPQAVMVKGGHMGTETSADVVVTADGVVVLERPRVPTRNDHGTGCSLSAAVAAQLALGMAPLDAVERAKEYVYRALVGAAGWRLGAGHGPIDHFGWTELTPD